MEPSFQKWPACFEKQSLAKSGPIGNIFGNRVKAPVSSFIVELQITWFAVSAASLAFRNEMSNIILFVAGSPIHLHVNFAGSINGIVVDS